MTAKITNVVDEAVDIKTFVFDQFFAFLPGQWIWVKLSENLKHHFTISSSPTEKKLQFTTKFREESDYKKFLWIMKVGDSIDIAGPHGEFILTDADTKPRLLLAGGMGITPFRSMLKYKQDKNLSIDMKLIYSLRNKSEGAFTDNGTLYETSKNDHLYANKIKELVPDYANRDWYVCGPSKFVDACVDISKTLAIPADNLHTEDFPGY